MTLYPEVQRKAQEVSILYISFRPPKLTVARRKSTV
jgi:hypothetical protein